MSDELRAAEEAALRAATDVLESRITLARAMGMTHAGLRDVWGKLGYDESITAQQYRDRYARGGIAARIVDALPKAVWRGDGDLFENDDPEKTTAFEQAWYDLNDQLRVWSTLQRVHILASLGSYSVLLLGAPGEMNTPLSRGRPGQLLYLTPFLGGVTLQRENSKTASAVVGSDVTIDEWDEDARSRRFGQPKTYKLKRTAFATTTLEKLVHWSRVIHVPSSGFIDDAVFGPPALEAVWNYLLDLDKVVGGGAEAFWLRANAGLVLNLDKKMGSLNAAPLPSPEEKKEMQEIAEKYEHQLTRMMRLRGVDVQQLGSDVADFKSPADAILTLISGTCGLPKRILTGSEVGELASTQDRDNWNDQVKDCRTSYAYPIVLRPFVERLIDYGYLPTPKQWEPKWPEMSSMSALERLQAAEIAAKLNDHGEVIVTGAEIREDYLDKEPLRPEDLPEPQPMTPVEEEQVAQLEAALRRGGALSIAVAPPRNFPQPEPMVKA